MQTQNRRLAAILFTDVVGFTSIMQRDEAAAIQTIRRHNQVLEKWASQYQGEVLNFFGDGCLCAFATATEAVRAAMHVQEELKNEPAIPLRIGLHIGEVSFEEGKALGDAVNIASRVQSLAVANSILFSREIYDKLKNHPEFKAVSLGQFEFKNVEEPMEVYALANDGFHVPKREEMSGKLKPTSKGKKTVNNKWLLISFLAIILIAGFLYYYKSNANQNIKLIKSIAVLPFKNESVAKAENEPFCNGITLAILKNLTWIKEFIPIAFQSTERYRQTTKSIPEIAEELDVNYVVLGNVQVYNDQIKVFVSLVNGETGQQMWADEFSGEIKDIFLLQDEIAKKIASELHVKLSPEENKGIERVATVNMAAWEKYNEALDKYVKLVLKNWPSYSNLGNDQEMFREFSAARNAADVAIGLDPAMSEAKILKGKVFLYGSVWNGFSDPSLKNIDTIGLMANQALDLDQNSVEANCLLAGYFRHKNQDDSVLKYVNRALSISPNNFEANRNAGDYFQEKDPVKAIKYYLKALRVDPVSIWTPGIYESIGATYSSVGDFKKAETYYKKGLEKLETNHGLFVLMIMYNHSIQPDSVIKYSDRMLKYDDKNALYQVAEVTCYQWKDWKKGEKIYEEVWNKYHEHENEHRWAIALYKTGHRAKADSLMEVSRKVYLKNYPDSYDMAGLYAWRGDKENAYRVLRKFNWGWTSAYLVQFDPLFDNLRNDQEFKDILKNVLDKKKKQREELAALEAKGKL